MNEIRTTKKISDGIRSSKKAAHKRVIQESRSFEPISVAKKPIQKATKERQQRYTHKQIRTEIDEPIFSRPKTKKTQRESVFQKSIRTISSSRKIITWIFYVLIYFGAILFFLNKNEQTHITLSPKTQEVSESKNLSVYADPNTTQLGFDIIAISDTREKIIKPSSMQAVSKRASGTIKVFNNYSTEPQKLSPETRFKSLSGKIFKLGAEGVTIPGKKGTDAGYIEVSVYAEQPGSDYNIDVTDFTIPGFKESGLTEKYNTIYGLSLKPFSGGLIGEERVIGDNQKKESVNTLEAELKESLIQKLEAEKTEKVILVDKSVQILYKEPLFINENDGMIKLKQDAQIFALVIEKKQLEDYLTRVYLPEVQIQEVALSDFTDIYFSYEDSSIIDFKNLKKIDILMKFKNYFIWNIDTEKVAESLLGSLKTEIPTILDSFIEVETADIHIQPFWQKKVSENIEDISIEISE